MDGLLTSSRKLSAKPGQVRAMTHGLLLPLVLANLVSSYAVMPTVGQIMRKSRSSSRFQLTNTGFSVQCIVIGTY